MEGVSEVQPPIHPSTIYCSLQYTVYSLESIAHTAHSPHADGHSRERWVVGE